MGNSISEMGNIFHKKSEEYQVVNITSKCNDPLLQPDKPTTIDRNEIDLINSQLSNLAYELRLVKDSSTTKNELNAFYGVLNEQSTANLDDHRKMHNVIHQLQKEILELRKQVEHYHELHYNYDLDQPDVFPDENEGESKVESPSPSVKEFMDIEKQLDIHN
jgi:hypothetical protein